MNKLKEKIKNLFAKKKSNEYFDKQGFFAITLLCLGVIGVAAYMITSGMGATEQINPLTQAEVTATDIAQNVQKIENGGLEQQLATLLPSAKISETTSDDVKPSALTTKYTAPLNGSITLGYSDKALIYSKTLKQWTTIWALISQGQKEIT